MSTRALALAVLASLIAAPAVAQITIEGSVQPAPPAGFGFPVGTADADNDGIPDYITSDGNFVDPTFANPTDPENTNGQGLPWNDTAIWANYDTTQNILVGDAGETGNLAISGGGVLRYQHLILGGVSERGTSNTSLSFDPTDGPNEFQLLTHLNDSAPGEGGVGTVVVNGFGSLFNNDPNLISTSDQTILNLGNGTATDNVIVDLDQATQDTTGTTPVTTREFGPNTGFDVIVGLNGGGAFQVLNGGRVEIQDSLMVAVDDLSTGNVLVDGVGSFLLASGRTELNETGVVTRAVDNTSFIGGRGSASMTVSAGGRADFRNGLSIGAPTGIVEAATSTTALGEGNGTGVTTVTGAGSVLNTYSGVINGGFNFDSGQSLALAVGSLRRTLLGPYDPTNDGDDNLQPGRLVIADGAVVNTTAANGLATTAADMAIGKLGEVSVRDATLAVGDTLISDGLIDGYGLIRARTMTTSIYSRIRGGDAGAEQGPLAQPLRLLLNGEAINNNNATFVNRGLVEGQLELQVTGAIDNEGTIEMGGEIFAGSLYTNTVSRIVGSKGASNPLRLRLYNDDQAGDTNPDDASNDSFGALHNRGLVGGAIDFIVAGGVVNGDNYLPTTAPPVNGSTAGGTIAATGRILAGTFLNNADAEVRVGAGESLSLLVNAEAPTEFPSASGIPTVGGPLQYRSMNLGSISVTGGDLEVGYSPEDSAPINLFTDVGVDRIFNAQEVFFNARYAVEDSATPGAVEETTAGTITINDGSLRLTTGMINSGIVAFTGGDNLVNGPVYNTGFTYGTAGTLDLPGTILVSGDGTTVTFEDDVVNDGNISIGPYDNVVNFLGDLSGAGAIEVALDGIGLSGSRGAYLTVADTVTINGGTIAFAFLTAPTSYDTDVSIALIEAGNLSEDSLFTNLVLPELGENQYWDVVYDTVNDQVRLEIVESFAIGADFTGDGIVSQDDVDTWIRNAGIESGASIIQGDADHDGDVDLADYDLLMEQLFTGVPVAIAGGPLFAATYVPEPTAAVLLCLAAASAGVTRRR